MTGSNYKTSASATDDKQQLLEVYRQLGVFFQVC
jgi:hypothetical protein